MSPTETEAPPAPPAAKAAAQPEKRAPESAAKTPPEEHRPEEKRDERDEKPPRSRRTNLPESRAGGPGSWAPLVLAVVAIILLSGARKSARSATRMRRRVLGRCRS